MLDLKESIWHKPLIFLDEDSKSQEDEWLSQSYRDNKNQIPDHTNTKFSVPSSTLHI